MIGRRPGHRRVHRPDRRGGRGARRATRSACCCERIRGDDPTADAVDRRRLALLRRARPPRAVRRRRPAVRTYFPFEQVRQGLLDVTGRLFGLSYARRARGRRHLARRGRGYDVVLDGDPHRPDLPRPAPARGQVQARRPVHLVKGVAGEQLAEGVLVCNFNRGPDGARRGRHALPRVRPPRPPRARRPGPVGPLLRRRHRVGLRRGAEPDARGVGLGRRRAGHLRAQRRGRDDPGRPGRRDAPGRRVRQGPLRRAADVLRRAVLLVPRQDRTTTSRPTVHELQRRYSVFPPLDGTHMHCAFGHLDGYSSGYYTYMWSLVIAKDLFSAFDPDDLFEADVAARVPRQGARAGRPRGRRRPGRRLPGPALLLRR